MKLAVAILNWNGKKLLEEFQNQMKQAQEQAKDYMSSEEFQNHDS